jgi:NodT family efflux transporter outer membrane factor (OMF) lipoprotein
MRCVTSKREVKRQVPRRSRKWRIIGVATVSVLASCAVGPDFHQPKPPEKPGYLHPSSDAAPVQAQARDVQNISQCAELADMWWQLFHSAQLDELVRTSIAASPTLVAANATLAQAREEVTVARAGFLPSVSAAAGAQRSGTGTLRAPDTGATTNLYNIGLSTSYSPDIFGGTRRAVEQQQALAEFQRDELAAAYLTLTGSVVNEVLIIASTRLQITTTEDLIASDRKNLAMTQRAFDVGIVPRSDVLTAESQLAADLTQLPSLHKQLDQAYDELAVLAGRAPSEWQVQPFDIDQFRLPRDIPLSLPARLVRQRPDVLAAEAQLHAASAAIGVAVAQEFPNISLSASITREALRAGDLFHQFDTLWDAAGSLTQPIFKGGALRAQVRAARDAFKVEAATYQAVVLEALGQVADDLWALQYDAQILTVDRHSMDVASEALKLQQQSYSVGTTTVLNLIAAERTYAQARLSYVSARVQQFTDSASLLTALGGGWWNGRIEAAAQ